jgi:hypothetical protein
VVIAERTYPMVRPGDLVFETVPQEGVDGFSNIS